MSHSSTATTYRGAAEARSHHQIVRAAYQGIPGAFSEEAIRALFRDAAQPVPFEDFAAAARTVVAGEADVAVLPVENTAVGSITESIDAVLELPQLCITGETTLRVRQQLLVVPGTTLEMLQRVESHPVALSQCRTWLARHPEIEPVPVYDTAAAARAVAERGDRTRAALGSVAAAERYGLEILERSIEDHELNRTRFWALALSQGIPPTATTSGGTGASRACSAACCITTGTDTAAIRDVVLQVSERGATVSVLACRPGQTANQRRYVVELEKAGVDVLERVLEEIAAMVQEMRVLGVWET